MTCSPSRTFGAVPPSLPSAQLVRLPRRGRTWVYDTGARPGTEARPPILLLHGWTATAALNFHTCFPALSERYRVVALDHRGHGRGIRSLAPFRLEDCADDAAALVAQLGLGPCTVVGYSMGGPIAQLMWRRHPEAVGALVLCATAAHFPGARFDGAFGLASAGVAAALALVPPFVRRAGMEYAAGQWRASRGVAAWAADEWGRHEPAALIQAGIALARFDSNPWLGEIDVPTAVLITERDVTVPPSLQKSLARRIPEVRIFPVDGDHRVVGEDPARFVPVLLAACDAVTRVGSGTGEGGR